MIETKVEGMLQDLGIDEENFAKCLAIGLKNQHHRKIFEQLLLIDNFLVFKRLMVKRNKELELEALKELEKEDKSTKPSTDVKLLELESEKADIDHALAVSLAA